jgi:hypothetical protein
MGFRTDFPIITITVRRDQKDWIQNENTLNVSGFIQDQLDLLIKHKAQQRKALLKEIPVSISMY